eukprot:TRINITY_DN798_c0_g1_i1.p1 TRINITY_DN798_c0_g1~~TRINITY_DN798_c0_g1_i1.p1  ORF type:complete len:497 (+),score=71.80 TRINITY_DN798_c0_g1_i1:117-1607(+)
MAAIKRKEEKLKQTLRELVQKEENRICMDCPTKSPQYVVLNFNTFVCTTCSALHRNLQHRVKGISMSQFTEEEVKALKDGGNMKAARIWRANWRPQSFPMPKEGDEKAIAAFIKMTYIERKWYSEQAAEEEAIKASLATVQPGDVGFEPPRVRTLTPPTAATAHHPHAPAAPIAPVAASPSVAKRPAQATPAAATHAGGQDVNLLFGTPAAAPKPAPKASAIEETDLFLSGATTTTPAAPAPAPAPKKSLNVDDLFGPSQGAPAGPFGRGPPPPPGFGAGNDPFAPNPPAGGYGYPGQQGQPPFGGAPGGYGQAQGGYGYPPQGPGGYPPGPGGFPNPGGFPPGPGGYPNGPQTPNYGNPGASGPFGPGPQVGGGWGQPPVQQQQQQGFGHPSGPFGQPPAGGPFGGPPPTWRGPPPAAPPQRGPAPIAPSAGGWEPPTPPGQNPFSSASAAEKKHTDDLFASLGTSFGGSAAAPKPAPKPAAPAAPASTDFNPFL